MKEELGINVMAFSCEGYKGVSQSAGHHIANNGVFKNIIGLDDKPDEAEFTMNILGEYNIGGDAWEIDTLLRKCGIHVTATLERRRQLRPGEKVRTPSMLNGVMCHRSINYIAEMMEKKFGIPWIKVNFIGAEATAKTLRKIAKFFDSKKLTDRVEEVIAQEMLALGRCRTKSGPGCQGKKAALFVGGSRAHHYQDLFRDIGMEIGLRRLRVRPPRRLRRPARCCRRSRWTPTAATSRNCTSRPIRRASSRRKTPEQMAALEAGGFSFKDYEGMMAEMKKDTLVIDDISHHEMEKLIEIYKPDIIGSGIKDKFVIEKMGVPCKQLHSYDYSGPYAAFTGAANFYREVDRMLNTKVWKFITPPWEKDPQLTADAGPSPRTSMARSEKAKAKSWRKPAAADADGPSNPTINILTNQNYA